MNPERYEKVRTIFLDVCEQPENERAKFLDEACAGDALLRSEVERLLPHLACAENFLSQPALGVGIAIGDVEDLAAGPGGSGRRAPLTSDPTYSAG